MSEESKQAVVNSFPFLQILTLIFITLKLLGHITWSWWWVIAPLWIPLVVVGSIFIIIGIVVGVIALGTWVAERLNRRL